MVSSNDMKPAERTYESFIGVVKWGAVSVAGIVVLVILLIT